MSGSTPPPPGHEGPLAVRDEHPASAGKAPLEAPRRRLVLGVLALLALSGVVAVATIALQGSVVYSLTPTEALSGEQSARFRLTGTVAAGSLEREAAGMVTFAVTDGTTSVPVRLDGRAPDSLADGAEIVIEGHLGADGVFRADLALARCPSRFEAVDDP